ncbi:Alpha-amylase precursor [Minicystis rosea]|nr:Alpha-amylase precursor [Minicystis rosea]
MGIHRVSTVTRNHAFGLRVPARSITGAFAAELAPSRVPSARERGAARSSREPPFLGQFEPFTTICVARPNAFTHIAAVKQALSRITFGLVISGGLLLGSACGDTGVAPAGGTGGAGGSGGGDAGPSVEMKRDVVVHLFEWPWADIALECESYLGPAGFAAVQVSPPSEHAVLSGHPWWERYQTVSYGLEHSRSGTAAAFQDMVSRCAAAGVGIYVDAVINHMTAQTKGTGSNGTAYTKYEYPGLYTAASFHQPTCAIQGSDYASSPENVQHCELLSLADLDTGKAEVQDEIAGYLAALVKMGVRGFRIDAAKHIAAAELSTIFTKVAAAVAPHKAPYYFLEVIDRGGEAIHSSDYLGVGDASKSAIDVTEFKYDIVSRAFLNQGGATLESLEMLVDAADMLPRDHALVFTANHDTARSDAVYYADGVLDELAVTFALTFPYGHPSLLSGYAFDRSTDAGRSQGPTSDAAGFTLPIYASGATAPSCATDLLSAAPGTWLCEHRRRFIPGLLAFRRAAADAPQVTSFWKNGNQIAYGRGGAGFVVLNRTDVPLAETLQTGLAEGAYCDVFGGGLEASACTGKAITVGADGKAVFGVPPMSAAVLHAGAKL